MSKPSRSLILCAAFAVASAHAAAPDWQRIQPTGGSVNEIAIGSATVRYALSHDRVFRSADGGQSWSETTQPAISMAPRAYGFSLAVDGAAPNRVFYGTTNGKLFRSTDSGQSWSAATIGASGNGIVRIVVDKADPQRIWAVDYGIALYVSTNGGATFALAASQPGAPTDLAQSASNSAVLYATSGTAGVYRSSNGGTSWTLQAAANGLALSINYDEIAIHPTDPNIAFVGGNCCATGYRTLDGGANWAVLGAGAPAFTAAVTEFAFDSANPAIVYAGYSSTNAGPAMYRSTNTGASWTGLAMPDGADWPAVAAITPHPSNANELLVGTIRGVFRSTDAGANWTAANAGMDSALVEMLAFDRVTAGRLYAAGDLMGVQRSDDGGTSWTPRITGLTSTSVRGLAVDGGTPARIYAGVITHGAETQMLSTDSGANWAPLDSSGAGAVTSAFPSIIATDPIAPAVVLAIDVNRGGVIRSTDDGVTWAAATSGLPASPPSATYALAIDPTDATHAYLALGLDTPFYTTDGGATWQAMNAPSAGRTVVSLAVAATNPVTLYAGTADGVHRSTNGGTSWITYPVSNLGATLGGAYVRGLAIDPADPLRVLAYVETVGIVASVDGGGLFVQFGTPITTGGTPGSAMPLAFDPLVPDRFYAAPDGVLQMYQGAITGTIATNLELSVAQDADPVASGGMLGYGFTVTHLGGLAGTLVQVTFTLPAGTSHVSSSFNGGTCVVTNPTTVDCTLTTLAIGANATGHLTLQPAASGVYVLNTVVASALPDPVSGDNSSVASTTVLAPALVTSTGGGGGGGGGGPMDPGTCLLLVAFVVARRMYASQRRAMRAGICV